MKGGCTCSERTRRWTDLGLCLNCGNPILEKQLVPVLLKILCAAGSGLVLWRNPQGFDEQRKVRYGFADGSSDYVGIYRGGQFVAVEFKTAAGRQSPEQKTWEELVRKQGGIYRIVRCTYDAMQLLWSLEAARATRET